MSHHDAHVDSDHLFLSADVGLNILSEPLQLGHGDTQHISTLPFRKCFISTKIIDLKRCNFRDGKTGDKREACVIIFELEFGSQVVGSSQRITNMSVWIMFEEIEEDGTEAESSGDVTPAIGVSDPDLACKSTYPRLAYGPSQDRAISSSRSAELKPAYMDISVGSVSVGRDVSHVQPFRAEYKASSAGSMGVKIDLKENELLKGGVPSTLRFAVLLQTDGLPFDVEVTFKGSAKQFGVRIGAKKVLRVGKQYLWYRRGGTDGLGAESDDADSDEFKEWVRTKTGNAWAEVVEYD